MTDSRKKVERSPANATFEQEIEAKKRSPAEGNNAVIRAEEVIYAAISNWTGIKVTRGDSIPIVRDDRKVGELRDNPHTVLSRCPVEHIAKASMTVQKKELKRKIKALKGVKKTTVALIEALGVMTNTDRFQLETSTWPAMNVLRDRIVPSKERLIREIGLVNSAQISAIALFKTATTQLDEVQVELEKHEVKRGPHKNEAAYAVALELARLYAKITGKRPTYSEDTSQKPIVYGGEFTPELRAVFDALGWEFGLRGPATEAIKAITETDLQYEEIRLGGLFTTLSRG